MAQSPLCFVCCDAHDQQRLWQACSESYTYELEIRRKAWITNKMSSLLETWHNGSPYSRFHRLFQLGKRRTKKRECSTCSDIGVPVLLSSHIWTERGVSGVLPCRSQSKQLLNHEMISCCRWVRSVNWIRLLSFNLPIIMGLSCTI